MELTDEQREVIARATVGLPARVRERLGVPIAALAQRWDDGMTDEQRAQVMATAADAIERLPPQPREAFIMRYVKMMERAEIERSLRITPDALSVRLQAATRLLREQTP